MYEYIELLPFISCLTLTHYIIELTRPSVYDIIFSIVYTIVWPFMQI